MSLFAICCALFLMISIITIIHSITKWKKKEKVSPKMPPGSMGWPIVGETLLLYSNNPAVFFDSRQKRYGEIFKTRILGCPCVMLASSEAVRFVLVTHASLFKPTYPPSKENLIGPSAIFFHQGSYHNQLRKLVQGSLSLNVIRNLIPQIEDIAISALESWCREEVVINTFHEMKKFSFEVAVLTVFGHLDVDHKENLKKNYQILNRGYNSHSTKLPGTAYSKSVMARRHISKILGEIISERKEKSLSQKDLLNDLLNHKDVTGRMVLLDNQIADNIIGVLFAAQDTTASVLTWILKYIHDDPSLLQAIMVEQSAIYESNERGKKPLTWSQTRHMPVTTRVVMESLRMASVISFTFREAVRDVEYKGHLIPKGWKALPLFRNIHHNSDLFNDPQVFDPSRFQDDLKPNTFMPFGNGVHACPGNEVAKLEILILIHHLVTKFGWKVVGSESGVEYDPFPVPKKGLPAKFWKQHRLLITAPS